MKITSDLVIGEDEEGTRVIYDVQTPWVEPVAPTPGDCVELLPDLYWVARHPEYIERTGTTIRVCNIAIDECGNKFVYRFGQPERRTFWPIESTKVVWSISPAQFEQVQNASRTSWKRRRSIP